MDEARIIKLYAKYDTCRQVADELGISAETVRRILIKNGVSRTGNRNRKAPKTSRRMPSNCKSTYCGALVVMLRETLGLTTSEIRESTGIPTNSIVNIFNRKRPDLKLARCQRVDTSTIDEIEKEYLAGASTYEIGDKYGLHHTTISSLMISRGHCRGKGKGVAVEKVCRARQEEAYARLIDEFGKVPCSVKKNRENRRRFRIANRKHNVGITWKTLAERNGSLTCEVCGIECDPNDKIWGSTGPTHPSVDHIIRIVDGGEDTWENSRLACMKCNLALNAKATKKRLEVCA